MADHKYCYPNSDVLINKLGIRDMDVFLDAERDLTAWRLSMLEKNPIQGHFDYLHLKQIHRFLFQDIYSWAGKERTVDIAKSGTLFCKAIFIGEQASEIFKRLKQEDFLCELTREKFVNRVAYYFGEINALHPFREGNGRTQREFFRELALNAGHEIHYARITDNEMIEASVDSFTGKYEKMFILLNKVVSQ